MKKYLLILIMVGVCLAPLGERSPAVAGETDVLINILVKKGILTPQEANDILSEMAKEGQREKAAVKEVAQEAAEETATKVAKKEARTVDLPSWVKNAKFKGDIRIRYQDQDLTKDNRPDRDRYRQRVRLGFETKVNEEWEAGIGMASGGADPRSTNDTWDDAFSTGDWRLDYAYAKYRPTPLPWLTAIGGQFKNPIWGTKDLLWDGDICPQGFAAMLNYKPTENLELFATPAYLIVDDVSTLEADPKAYLLQAGLKYDMKPFYFKVAGTYYDWQQLDDQAPGATAPNSFSGTNSTNAAGNLAFDYDAFALDAEIGAKLPWSAVPYAAVFGQYVKSDASDTASDGTPSATGHDDDTGWLVGFKFGHKKVSSRWQWQATYNYRHLETDAWPDFLPDSDAFGGATNIKGSEFEFVLGLHKNVTIGVDYYMTEVLDNDHVGMTPDQEERLLQVDLILKW
jgi:polyhydroxyalkanoate synthesis regulator phasin